jgi:signal transduction histidine kinase
MTALYATRPPMVDDLLVNDLFGLIDISDTGPGIAPDMLDQLFKPFATSKTEWHGIGLALVKRFVDYFGGNVTVDSQPGAGATLHLRLPLTASPARDSAASFS